MALYEWHKRKEREKNKAKTVKLVSSSKSSINVFLETSSSHIPIHKKKCNSVIGCSSSRSLSSSIWRLSLTNEWEKKDSTANFSGRLSPQIKQQQQDDINKADATGSTDSSLFLATPHNTEATSCTPPSDAREGEEESTYQYDEISSSLSLFRDEHTRSENETVPSDAAAIKKDIGAVNLSTPLHSSHHSLDLNDPLGLVDVRESSTSPLEGKTVEEEKRKEETRLKGRKCQQMWNVTTENPDRSPFRFVSPEPLDVETTPQMMNSTHCDILTVTRPTTNGPPFSGCFARRSDPYPAATGAVAGWDCHNPPCDHTLLPEGDFAFPCTSSTASRSNNNISTIVHPSARVEHIGEGEGCDGNGDLRHYALKDGEGENRKEEEEEQEEASAAFHLSVLPSPPLCCFTSTKTIFSTSGEVRKPWQYAEEKLLLERRQKQYNWSEENEQLLAPTWSEAAEEEEEEEGKMRRAEQKRVQRSTSEEKSSSNWREVLFTPDGKDISPATTVMTAMTASSMRDCGMSSSTLPKSASFPMIAGVPMWSAIPNRDDEGTYPHVLLHASRLVMNRMSSTRSSPSESGSYCTYSCKSGEIDEEKGKQEEDEEDIEKNEQLQRKDLLSNVKQNFVREKAKGEFFSYRRAHHKRNFPECLSDCDSLTRTTEEPRIRERRRMECKKDNNPTREQRELGPVALGGEKRERDKTEQVAELAGNRGRKTEEAHPVKEEEKEKDEEHALADHSKSPSPTAPGNSEHAYFLPPAREQGTIVRESSTYMHEVRAKQIEGAVVPEKVAACQDSLPGFLPFHSECSHSSTFSSPTFVSPRLSAAMDGGRRKQIKTEGRVFTSYSYPEFGMRHGCGSNRSSLSPLLLPLRQGMGAAPTSSIVMKPSEVWGAATRSNRDGLQQEREQAPASPPRYQFDPEDSAFITNTDGERSPASEPVPRAAAGGSQSPPYYPTSRFSTSDALSSPCPSAPSPHLPPHRTTSSLLCGGARSAECHSPSDISEASSAYPLSYSASVRNDYPPSLPSPSPGAVGMPMIRSTVGNTSPHIITLPPSFPLPPSSVRFRTSLSRFSHQEMNGGVGNAMSFLEPLHTPEEEEEGPLAPKSPSPFPLLPPQPSSSMNTGEALEMFSTASPSVSPVPLSPSSSPSVSAVTVLRSTWLQSTIDVEGLMDWSQGKDYANTLLPCSSDMTASATVSPEAEAPSPSSSTTSYPIMNPPLAGGTTYRKKCFPSKLKATAGSLVAVHGRRVPVENLHYLLSNPEEEAEKLSEIREEKRKKRKISLQEVSKRMKGEGEMAKNVSMEGESSAAAADSDSVLLPPLNGSSQLRPTGECRGCVAPTSRRTLTNGVKLVTRLPGMRDVGDRVEHASIFPPTHERTTSSLCSSLDFREKSENPNTMVNGHENEEEDGYLKLHAPDNNNYLSFAGLPSLTSMGLVEEEEEGKAIGYGDTTGYSDVTPTSSPTSTFCALTTPPTTSTSMLVETCEDETNPPWFVPSVPDDLLPLASVRTIASLPPVEIPRPCFLRIAEEGKEGDVCMNAEEEEGEQRGRGAGRGGSDGDTDSPRDRTTSTGSRRCGHHGHPHSRRLGRNLRETPFISFLVRGDYEANMNLRVMCSLPSQSLLPQPHCSSAGTSPDGFFPSVKDRASIQLVVVQLFSGEIITFRRTMHPKSCRIAAERILEREDYFRKTFETEEDMDLTGCSTLESDKLPSWSLMDNAPCEVGKTYMVGFSTAIHLFFCPPFFDAAKCICVIQLDGSADSSVIKTEEAAMVAKTIMRLPPSPSCTREEGEERKGGEGLPSPVLPPLTQIALRDEDNNDDHDIHHEESGGALSLLPWGFVLRTISTPYSAFDSSWENKREKIKYSLHGTLTSFLQRIKIPLQVKGVYFTRDGTICVIYLHFLCSSADEGGYWAMFKKYIPILSSCTVVCKKVHSTFSLPPAPPLPPSHLSIFDKQVDEEARNEI